MPTRSMVLTALFIALSFIGANVKIMGTIAFDSMPGFLAALLLGPNYGAVIAAVGHFFTALLAGFPLSIPVHFIIMLDMAATMAVFGAIYRRWAAKDVFSVKGSLLAGGAGVVVNGPGSLFVLMPFLLPVMGESGMLLYLPVLSGAALLNIILAFIIYRLLFSVRMKGIV